MACTPDGWADAIVDSPDGNRWFCLPDERKMDFPAFLRLFYDSRNKLKAG